jgi:hypothetical protein
MLKRFPPPRDYSALSVRDLLDGRHAGTRMSVTVAPGADNSPGPVGVERASQ